MWILILIGAINGTGVSMASVQFKTATGCQVAVKNVLVSYPNFVAFCVQDTN